MSAETTGLRGEDMDPKALAESWMARREHKQKFNEEIWIRTMETKLVQEQLAKCYQYEGVNQKQNCAELAKRYLDMMKTHKMEGYLARDTQPKE